MEMVRLNAEMFINGEWNRCTIEVAGEDAARLVELYTEVMSRFTEETFDENLYGDLFDLTLREREPELYERTMEAFVAAICRRLAEDDYREVAAALGLEGVVDCRTFENPLAFDWPEEQNEFEIAACRMA